jgi:hypothetical protein
VTQPSSIAVSTSVSDYFKGVVDDALRSRNIEASTEASHYLVGILCDYAHLEEGTSSAFSRPLVFQLRDALEASGPERFQRLRALGDGVLYGIGFFGGHIELRGIDRSYVMSVGVTAYDNAAAMLQRTNRRAGHDVLTELAKKFEKFVHVLNEVAEGALAHATPGPRGLVQLYERWLKTGSTRLAQELGARGLVPTRGKEGLN